MKILTILVMFMSLACANCHNPPVPVQDIINCTMEDQDAIKGLLGQMLPLLTGGKTDWDNIEGMAISNGEKIGGCALSLLIQQYLATPRATMSDDTWKAHDMFDHYRTTQAHGATFRTEKGDL